MYPKNSIELLRSQRRKELDFVYYKKKKSTTELIAIVKEQLDRDHKMKADESQFTKAIMEMRR